MPIKNKQKKFLETYRDVGPYLGLGTQLAATIILMFFLGRWLDQKFETDPILTIIFSFFGGFAGVYNFIRTVLNMNKKKKND
ncbi:MAG TPA: AtpZ/AtpI family protein [Ignavibacteria bacterium]|nr:AtpZ/AtpI family protein [Ignavibacteria bacterium]